MVIFVLLKTYPKGYKSKLTKIGSNYFEVKLCPLKSKSQHIYVTLRVKKGKTAMADTYLISAAIVSLGLKKKRLTKQSEKF